MNAQARLIGVIVANTAAIYVYIYTPLARHLDHNRLTDVCIGMQYIIYIEYKSDENVVIFNDCI